ncbi:hypothetical protein NPIL_374181 [Nephila pilipes]|uniref:Uncharacterized protein n=1 Tax=Nephila pilipes TaxID=299642 RepID=A0A8X6NZI7_NEPPI|nr:hypothetical protein NPIL_374181 [Nephila pilipes]
MDIIILNHHQMRDIPPISGLAGQRIFLGDMGRHLAPTTCKSEKPFPLRFEPRKRNLAADATSSPISLKTFCALRHPTGRRPSHSQKQGRLGQVQGKEAGLL